MNTAQQGDAIRDELREQERRRAAANSSNSEMTPLRDVIAKALPKADPPKSLVSKLAEVMAATARVPKHGRNEFHKYDYATEADIVDAVRLALAERHIMLIPSVLKATRDGTLMTVEMVFTFHDGENGTSLELPFIGVGEDKSDKAIWKALTGAVKYCLLKCFLIPTGDDPGDDPERDEARPAPKPPRKAPPPPKGVDVATGEIREHGGFITPAQVKRLWSIARKIGWKDDELKAWLQRDYQIDSTSLIHRLHYDAIMATIEAGTERE